MNKNIVSVMRLLVVLAMPVFLVLTSARIMVTDWYPRFEYAKADFPPDRYGFTQVQRLELALVCIHFLNRPEPPEVAIAMLEALRLPGTNQPLFNKYELSHMIDVKRLTDVLWRVLWVSGIVVIGGLVLLLARPGTRREGILALFGGGLLTTVLLVLLVGFVLLSWRTFFITFHDVFFPPGTWTFDWSDSLIRLFPDRFWFDAGTLLTGGALAAGILVAVVGYVLKRLVRA